MSLKIKIFLLLKEVVIKNTKCLFGYASIN